jgi:hypothetical protein
VSLVARHLEAQGLPTVVLGCARDIVEQCADVSLLVRDTEEARQARADFWQGKREAEEVF